MLEAFLRGRSKPTEVGDGFGLGASIPDAAALQT